MQKEKTFSSSMDLASTLSRGLTSHGQNKVKVELTSEQLESLKDRLYNNQTGELLELELTVKGKPIEELKKVFCFFN